MPFTDLIKSKNFRRLITIVGGIIIILVVFQAGMFVGFRKASFAFRWADSYHRNFGGPRGGFLRDFEGRDFIGGHGTAGVIVKIDGATIVVKGQDDVEKIVAVTTSTTIKRGRDSIQVSDLKVNDRMVAIGSPNDDGSIEPKMIRIFDANEKFFAPPHPRGFKF